MIQIPRGGGWREFSVGVELFLGYGYNREALVHDRGAIILEVRCEMMEIAFLSRSII